MEGISPFIFLSTRSTLLSAAKIQGIWNSNTSTWIPYTHTSARSYILIHTHTYACTIRCRRFTNPATIRRWWLITRDDHRADRSVAFVLSDSDTTRSVTTQSNDCSGPVHQRGWNHIDSMEFVNNPLPKGPRFGQWSRRENLVIHSYAQYLRINKRNPLLLLLRSKLKPT